MTPKELVDILKTISGLPLYTARAPLGAKLPYMVLTFGGTNNFIADNKVSEVVQDQALELYTVNKDLTTEGKVEKLLNDNGIPWQSDEASDDGEQFYLKYYYFIRRS